MAFTPWAHQTEGREEVHRLIAQGVRRICLSSPTGGGKSTTMQMLTEDFISQDLPTAFFTNRKLLTAQLSRGLNASGIHVGIRAANFESWTDPNAPVQVCSIQTEAARVLKKRERAVQSLSTEAEAHRKYKLFPAKRVFVDEAHLNTGEQMCQILREYQEKYDAVIIGVTATPVGIGHMYDELIVAGNNSDLRNCGCLVPAYCYEPASFDIWKIRRKKTGVLPSQKELEARVKHIWSQVVVGLIYDHWNNLNPDAKPALCMAPGVKESLGLAQEFTKHGVNSAHIDGGGLYVDGKYYHTTEQEDRDEIFAKAKDGRIAVIFNRFTMREAVDLPWLEHLILATPIASLTAFVQVCGRVLRACPETEKKIALITDHGGAIRMHGSPNMDRNLEWKKYFREDADKITKDRIEGLRDGNPNGNEREPITCPECGMMRQSGPKCPGCGHQHEQSVRKVIQEDGTLVPVTGDIFKKRRVTIKPNTVQVWKRFYYACRNAKKPMSFLQARAAFFHEMHYWPPKDLPLMPRDPLDWKRKIKDVPASSLVEGEQFAKPKAKNPQREMFT